MRSELLRTRAGRAVAGALALLALATGVGLVALWPGDRPDEEAALGGGPAQRAETEKVARVGCELSREPCQRVTVKLRSGPENGERTTLTIPGTDIAPEVEEGDALRVIRNFSPDPNAARGPFGAAGTPGAEAYAFADFDRRSPLIALGLIFVLVVVVFGRRRGALSLVGLGISLLVLTQFLVPAILDGKAPLLVALVGSLAIMFATIALTHGVGAKSLAALLGSATTLLLTALLALIFVEVANITGFSSTEATLLRGTPGGSTLSLEGLVLAGVVVGALGVLDDVTISQASTVLALRRADPAQAFRQLYRSAIDVGRDHLGATVNTLVLAYAGAALPLLLLFSNQQTSFGTAVNRESVATELVAMGVGSIGLVAAVPLTTALASLLARRLPDEALGPDEHHHGHAH